MLKKSSQGMGVRTSGGSAPAQQEPATTRLGRRSFLKRASLGGAALLPAGALLTRGVLARGQESQGGLNKGDVAILRLLAAAEILESDLWQQYKEISLGNVSFIQAIQVLDGDMPTYVNQNTRDEFSHASASRAIKNAFLSIENHNDNSDSYATQSPISGKTSRLQLGRAKAVTLVKNILKKSPTNGKNAFLNIRTYIEPVCYRPADHIRQH